MDLSESKSTRILICLALALATVGIYCRVAGFDFVGFDDPLYVTGNPMVRDGLTLRGLRWAFTHGAAGNWHPLTWISLMLDAQLFGPYAGGYHLVNVGFHAANSVLLFLLLWRLTGAQWRSAAVAAIFAIHPLHVESVAWISERKDVLSMFFGLLTLLAYARYVELSKGGAAGGPNPKLWFRLGLGLFVLALMSKSMLVTLPFILLLLDFWPLQRLENIGWRTFFSAQFGRLVREKWVWFAAAAACCAITIYTQKAGGAVATLKNLPLSQRLVVAVESYCWYLLKLFWPARLALLYPLHVHRPLAPFIAACVFLLCVSGASIVTARRWPFFLTGWFWFLGALVPVIGIVQVGLQATADRYSYLPSIGLSIAVIWLGYELVKGSKFRLALGGCTAGIALISLSVATFLQLNFWRNGVALAQRAVQLTPDNDAALDNLGWCFLQAGQYDNALRAFKAALQINPSSELYRDIGAALEGKGELDQALRSYEQAAELAPEDAAVQHGLASVLFALGRKDEAISHYETAVRLSPGNPLFQNDLGAALASVQRAADALPHYEEAARLDPSSADFQNNLATALARSGQEDAAIGHYQVAIRDDPAFADPHSNLGALFASKHRLDDAAREYSTALELAPANPAIRLNAGLLFLKMGRNQDALNQFAEAARLAPGSSEARYELGHQLLLHGSLPLARQELDEAVRLNPDYAPAQFYLGLACLESNSTEQGLQHLQAASRLRPNWAEPLNALAWVLATSEDDKFRNSAEAIRLAEQAATVTSRQQPNILLTLSAAYANADRFDEAIASANEAAGLAQHAGQANLLPRIQEALTLYKAHKPYREKQTAD